MPSTGAGGMARGLVLGNIGAVLSLLAVGGTHSPIGVIPV